MAHFYLFRQPTITTAKNQPLYPSCSYFLSQILFFFIPSFYLCTLLNGNSSSSYKDCIGFVIQPRIIGQPKYCMRLRRSSARRSKYMHT